MTESKGRKMTQADKFKWQTKHDKIIKSEFLKQAKSKDTFLVIHGARALNKQLPPKYRRPTKDWDTWAKKPKVRMDKIEDRLDFLVKCDMFYEKQISVDETITGKKGKVYQVYSRLTGEPVVEYMKVPKGKGYYKVIGGIRWQTLDHAKMIYKSILQEQNKKHRWAKTRRDLNRIEAFERSAGGT